MLFMLLALVLLLSLCACGNKNNQTTDPSNMTQSTTESTEASTTATQSPTEATQTPTEATTADPTESTQDPTDATLAPIVCEHTWNAATCTTPKTCSKCGATEGDPAEHIWNAATCTTPQTCSQCETTKGKAAGHSWEKATCTTPKTCSVCKITQGTATGHKWTDATCSAPKTCSVCKATKGNALAHNWGNWYDANDSYDPCTEDHQQYRNCSTCSSQEERTVKAAHDYQKGFCTRCDDRDESYAFTYIDFNDKLFEAYIKQNLGIAAQDKVAVEDMKKLKNFTIEKRVTDVRELKYATNLEEITIEASNVSNLNALSGLPIKDVTLNCEELDVSFMRNLKKVECVAFNGCKLSGGTMEDVVSSPKLMYGYFTNTGSKDISFLSKATNLKSLDFDSIFPETDLSVLTTLPNLKKIDFHSELTEEQYLVTDQLIISGVVVTFP